MIYGRMGNEIELAREATPIEVLKDWGHDGWKKSKKYAEDEKLAYERCGYGMMWWGKSKDSGVESIYELAYCKADGGWAEIDDLRKAKMKPLRYATVCGKPID